MSRDRHQQHNAVRVFKGETVFDWDAEPSDERPSTFVESTQYGALLQMPRRSMPVPLEVRRPRPPRKRAGVGNAWVGLIVAVGLAAIAIVAYMRFAPEPSSAATVARP